MTHRFQSHVDIPVTVNSHGSVWHTTQVGLRVNYLASICTNLANMLPEVHCVITLRRSRTFSISLSPEVMMFYFFYLVYLPLIFLFFFFNNPAPPEIYPLPLHAPLPI